MKDFEYPLIDKINESNCNINMLISPRNHRKSTQIQFYLVDKFINKGEKFLILRRKIDETISASWLSDYARKISKNNDLELTSANIDRYVVEFRLNGDVCGYGAYCSVSSKYKSNDYGFNTDIKNVVLEEAIAENELETSRHYNLINKILSVVSTFCRYSEPTIYLLGNDCINGYHSPLIKSFNLTNKFATINKIVKTNYLYLEKNYTVAYYYFTDNIDKCEWLKGENNIKTLNFEEYEKVVPVEYTILYNNETYYIYIINSKFIYISSEIYNNKSFYTESDFLKSLNIPINIIKMIENKVKTGRNLLLTYYPELTKCYSFKVVYGARFYEYIPQEKESEQKQNVSLNIDEFLKLDIDEQYNSEYIKIIDNLMMLFNKYNYHLIFDSLPLKLTLDEMQITKII